jgi:hypothetical protein
VCVCCAEAILTPQMIRRLAQEMNLDESLVNDTLLSVLQGVKYRMVLDPEPLDDDDDKEGDGALCPSSKICEGCLLM